MKIAYDSEAHAAYIYLKDPIRPGEAAWTSPYHQVQFDYDSQGKLIGIEILDPDMRLIAAADCEII